MEMERVREMERNAPSPSSSAEDEIEALVIQNGANPSAPRDGKRDRNLRLAGIDIGTLRGRLGRGFWSNWKFIILICLPLFLVILYYSVDIGGVFRGVPTFPVEAPNERMREAELRALYLLRNQQLGLLRLWNRTKSAGSVDAERGPVNTVHLNSSGGGHDQMSDFSSSPNLVSLEEFRSALLEQIELNTEAQKALLSAHHVGNSSYGSSNGNVDPYLSDSSSEVCRKVTKPAVRKTMEWKPKKDRYLFAICVSGQMSNHLICLEKHIFVAALLNRVLIFPSPKFDYQYDRVINISHINDCFGRKVVISFEEFAKMKRRNMQIDRFICYMANPPCFVDEEHVKKLKGLAISLTMPEAAWPEDAKSTVQKKRFVADITSRFACEDEVLAIGDMFYADVEEEWLMQPGGPLSHKCETVIQPTRLIMLTAERFVQTFLGNNFIALHFRRHGFLKFCNAKEESCFFPIPQAAECIRRVVERVNSPVIYLSTDAAESEIELLQSLAVLNNKMVPLIKRPSHTSAEKWDALLYRHHLGEDNQVEAMLDKTICAMSNVFIGSSGSTFSDHIYHLRKDWGLASACDEYLCHGQRPNFIASKE